jgi:hypothetical protein
MTPRFITKVELSYDKARIRYSFPLDALTPGGVRGATASGSIMILGNEKRVKI